MLTLVVSLLPRKGNENLRRRQYAEGGLQTVRDRDFGTAKLFQFSLLNRVAVCRLLLFLFTVRSSTHVSGKEQKSALNPE